MISENESTHKFIGTESVEYLFAILCGDANANKFFNFRNSWCTLNSWASLPIRLPTGITTPSQSRKILADTYNRP
ncbi:hypothetical protein OQZ33_06615 [Pedobacter sp. MC2016-05]|uniref:hypothetical protein n=1 Tax=Pedobacter sp. MC2016-05 TaxID=2994474 RepID=UPI0022457A78|nr:hypothetical protein [Pedobacter sp. MC2016-05]MCX2473998.1 hypothetical protein [Pedobacter sp. MC2016-05]